MKKLLLAFLIAGAFGSTVIASDIAFYIGPYNPGWYGDEQFDHVNTIISLSGQWFADIQQFDDTQFTDFTAWIEANTADGELDIIWLNGTMPSVLYQFPNVDADGSPAETWLDNGNMIINVGDWFAYMSYEGGSRSADNGPAGAGNILDLNSGVIASADGTQLTVTPEGHQYLPSLPDTVETDRPVVLGQVVAPWEVAAVFASTDGTANGAQADPVVIHNTETGGYLAIVNQDSGSGWLDDRGVTCAELINNWVATVVGLGDPTLAGGPNPEDEAIDVPRDVVLSWLPGRFAATHDVYFGTVLDDVNNATRSDPRGVLVSQGQADTTFDPAGLLDLDTTYYWRIDEVNAPPDSTIFKGVVWSFTTEPVAYPIADVIATSNGVSEATAGPENTVNGSGLNEADQHSTNSPDMWLALPPDDEDLYIQYEFDRVYKLHEMLVWNYNVQFELILGFGLKDVTVEYSENGTDWTTLGDAVLNRATAKATYAANSTVELGGVPAKYVRLTVNSGYGMMGQYGLSEVRFTFIPAHAREPEPADGATGVEPTSALSWRAGREAVSHEVYLGGDPADLPLVDTVGTASYAADLEFGSTYYWQIVEVNEADAVPTWPSDVWSFSTQEYALIDGMETYDDDIEAGTTIFDTWIDGWVNDNGSTVGYFDAPFAEKTIVHSGAQSMPLAYDNASAPFYSEAERTFDSPQNWTGNGADTLVLYIRGNAPDFVEAADGSIVMSAIGTDIWGTADQFRFAYKSLNGDGSMTVRVDSLIRSNEWAKAGIMIRETLEPGSKHAFAAATPEPSHGLSFQRRPVAGQASANTDVAAIDLPEWVKLTRAGNIFTMQYSEDGTTWIDVTPAAPVDIQMNANVYIGLAVTSHDAAITTAAEFSNVSTTGNVTGAWQTAEIGVAQPVGNSADPMYVILEDSSGGSATAVNPDDAITGRPTWQEWAIPYSELTGVNLSRVEKMIIGVGSPTSPSAGGTGTVYIDDIGYGRPVAQ